MERYASRPSPFVRVGTSAGGVAVGIGVAVGSGVAVGRGVAVGSGVIVGSGCACACEIKKSSGVTVTTWPCPDKLNMPGRPSIRPNICAKPPSIPLADDNHKPITRKKPTNAVNAPKLKPPDLTPS